MNLYDKLDKTQYFFLIYTFCILNIVLYNVYKYMFMRKIKICSFTIYKFIMKGQLHGVNNFTIFGEGGVGGECLILHLSIACSLQISQDLFQIKIQKFYKQTWCEHIVYLCLYVF